MTARRLLSAGDDLEDGRFEVEEFLGSGGYGCVYAATDRLTSRKVAVKVESRDDPTAKGQLENEAHILNYLRRARNEQILGYVCYGETETVRYLVMEKCGQNLRQLKRKTPHDRFSIPTGLYIMMKMLSSLRFLHSLQLIHRDVKPENFCIGVVTQRQIYLIDYGLCRRADRPHRNPHFFGTARYASVRALQKQHQTKYDDLWSVFYSSVENLVGALPWRHHEDKPQILQAKQDTNLMTLCYGDEGVPPASLVALYQMLSLMLDDPLAHIIPPDYNEILGRVEHDLAARRFSHALPLDWQKPTTTTAAVGNKNQNNNNNRHHSRLFPRRQNLAVAH